MYFFLNFWCNVFDKAVNKMNKTQLYIFFFLVIILVFVFGIKIQKIVLLQKKEKKLGLKYWAVKKGLKVLEIASSMLTQTTMLWRINKIVVWLILNLKATSNCQLSTQQRNYRNYLYIIIILTRSAIMFDRACKDCFRKVSFQNKLGK